MVVTTDGTILSAIYILPSADPIRADIVKELSTALVKVFEGYTTTTKLGYLPAIWNCVLRSDGVVTGTFIPGGGAFGDVTGSASDTAGNGTWSFFATTGTWSVDIILDELSGQFFTNGDPQPDGTIYGKRTL